MHQDIPCRACGERSQFLWFGNLLDLRVAYYQCPACDYLQTEEPYWLDRAYSEAINSSDTGILVRNSRNARLVLATLLALGRPKGQVVDCAGGFGLLVRLLRDFGVSALWADRYCQNLVARGFEYSEGKADLVTAFEAFEHFVDPTEELARLLTIAPHVLLSTELLPHPAPKHSDWWYYGREHGQHIGFFSVKTLEEMAHAHGKFLLTDGHSCHLLTNSPRARLLWPFCRRLARFMPLLLSSVLKSKTWSDHLTISRQN